MEGNRGKKKANEANLLCIGCVNEKTSPSKPSIPVQIALVLGLGGAVIVFDFESEHKYMLSHSTIQSS